MKYFTHLTFCALALDAFNMEISLAALIFSLLPDIDSPNSILGRKIRPLSDYLNENFAHRGLMHSIWPMAIICALSFFFNNHSLSLAYASHLFLDSLNPFGIMLFYPNNSRFAFIDIKVKSGSYHDSLLGVLFLGLLFAWRVLK